jgi:AbrB family looped-hinge helix DNA binding protein
MKESLTVLTRKGQITVPVEIRRALGLKEGDKIAVSLRDDDASQASLRPVRSVTVGAVTPRKRPEDLDELRRLAEETVAEEAMTEDRRTKSRRV